jgi:hypothetical protein
LDDLEFSVSIWFLVGICLPSFDGSILWTVRLWTGCEMLPNYAMSHQSPRWISSTSISVLLSRFFDLSTFHFHFLRDTFCLRSLVFEFEIIFNLTNKFSFSQQAIGTTEEVLDERAADGRVSDRERGTRNKHTNNVCYFSPKYVMSLHYTYFVS